MFNRKAVFFDRDGTLVDIIERRDHSKERTAPFTLDEVKFSPDVYRVLTEIKKMGFLRIMITNQPDVRHGYLEEETWQKIHRRIVDTLGMDDVFMCRHIDKDNCLFRKPSPLMMESAADKWGINLRESYMIGDTEKDMESGRRAGCRTIILHKHYNSGIRGHIRVPNLDIALDIIKACERGN